MKSNIFIIAIITFTISSCNDFIQEDPRTFFSEESVFTTEAGVESAVNGIYASMNSGAYYGTAWHSLVLPHSGIFASSQQQSRDATSLNAQPSNPWISDIWSQAYKTINNANTVIGNLENTTLKLKNKETALGEAYFLRGVAYLDLIRLFGGVPFRTERTTIDDIHLPRTDRATIINQIEVDLQNAKKMMPDFGSTINGKPSKYAANVYLARLYMQLAGEDGGNKTNWVKAKTELQEIYDSKKFKLAPTFESLFTPGNENTVESIYELQYGHTGGVRNSDIVRFYTPSESVLAPPSAVTFGRIKPNKEIFDDHGKQYPNDPRITSTFIFDSYVKKDGSTQTIYPKRKKGNNGYAFIKKWIDPSYNGTTTERNYILARYADVLLMLAEVENEINGPASAYTFVNEVLKRARDTNGDGTADTAQPADWSGMTQEVFRDRIMKERRYELLSEGQEWFDSRRRGYDYFLKTVIKVHNENTTLDPEFDFVYPDNIRNMLLPIPTSEISGNQAISDADQNEGY